MRRLGEFASDAMQGDLEGLDDIVGQNVTIHSARIAEGKYGDFAIMRVEDVQGITHDVGSSAMFVLTALRQAIASNAFPIQAKFYRRNRTWVFE